MRTADLKLNDRNPRKISEGALKKLAESIQRDPEFMTLRPIVIDGENTVLGGNQRLKAIRSLGMEEIPEAWVVKASDLSEEQMKRFILVDNGPEGMAGEWDLEILKLDWELPELEGLGFDMADFDIETESKDAEPQIDRAAELNEKWQVKPGDLYLIGEHKLLCGDSTCREDVERVMGGGECSCIFTSPPYAVGMNYGESYDDDIENLRAMLPKLSLLWMDTIQPGGFAVVNYGDVVSGAKIIGEKVICQYPMALEYWPIFRADGWLLWSQRIWCKPIGRVSAPWCASSNRGATNWEHLWTWRKPGGEQTKPKTGNEFSSMHGWCDSGKMAGVDVGKQTHGAGMALGIAQWMIHVHTADGGIVHEPFCGTGTTMVAAQNLNRKCYGLEISPNYCAVILERMATAFPDIDIHKAD